MTRFRLTLALAAAVLATTPSLAAGPGRPSGMQVYRVCKADMKTFCPHTGLGSAAQKKCMRAHYDELSAPCKEILDRYEAKAAETPGNSAH